MLPSAPKYSTKELTRKTYPDFVRLFEKHPAPGAFSCWCMYHQRAPLLITHEQTRSNPERATRNRRQKEELVESGRSHGILVYSEGEPVGWCQYGSWKELPRIENNQSHRGNPREGGARKLWRITCFTVDKTHRKRGVAGAALKAALEAIRRKGGGLVEAYPIVRWGAYREYLGTVSMFRKEGFKVVAPFGKSNAVVRRII